MSQREAARARSRAWDGKRASIALGMLLGAPLAAPADEAPAAAAASPADTSQLHEIIVYARRRAEPIEAAPLAISVRSGEELREACATSSTPASSAVR